MALNPFKIENDLGKTGDLSGNYKNSWVEESFDVESGSSKISVAHTSKYIGTSIDGARIKFLFGVIGVIFFIIFSRLVYLQMIAGDEYRSIAEGNRIRIIPIASERGIIYDRYNRDLLKNIPGFSLAIIPQDLPRKEEDREKIIEQVAKISDLSVDEIKSLIKKYSQYSYESLTVKNNLDYYKALKFYVENANLPGVQVESGSKRGYYINPTTSSSQGVIESLSHLIGYVGKLNDNELIENRSFGYLSSDIIGKTGLEKSYEAILRGTYGKKKIEVNAIGKEQSVLAMEPPKPGMNLVLTIDLDAQKKLESLIEETVNSTRKRRIAAVAINPNNGEILAMVSSPGFDNNLFSGGIKSSDYEKYLNDSDNPLFNRVISGQYPPGSTVKLVMSAAGLQEQIINKDTTINSVGGIEVGGSFFKDWRAGGHGYTNVTKAIAWSVNSFYYYIGGGYEKFVGLGIERMAKFFYAFGLGKKSGIDLPGESPGFIPTKEWKQLTKNEQWYVGDTYNVSIGQGDLLVTPLQVAVWTSIVASGGKIITPHLGKEIVEPVTGSVQKIKFTTQNINEVSEVNLKIVREGMRECVTYGSCNLLKNLTFMAAGKTGTAQWSRSKPTHAWFTSFAPYNKPQIVVTILVEDGGEGSVIAQPIAQKFLEWWGKKYLD